MAIKRYTAKSDTTITNAFKSDLVKRGVNSNMGESDIIEAFSIYAQSTTSSLEKSRILIQHSMAPVLSDRQAGKIPASGSVDFYLRVFNAKHGQSVPKKYYMDISPISRAWTEGSGLDMEGYRDKGSACWLSASSERTAQVVKTSFKSDTRNDYAAKYVSIFNGLNQRINFWFQSTGAEVAPTLTGTEYEVNIGSETTKEGIAEEYKSLVNANTSKTGLTAAYSGSSTSVVLVTNDVLAEASEPVDSINVTNVYESDIEVKGKSAILWQAEGGDVYTEGNVNYSSLPLASQYFDDVEDAEINITSLVEEWLQAEAASNYAAATAEVTFGGQPADGSKITLTDTDGKIVTYDFTAGTTTGQYKVSTTEISVDTGPAAETAASFATAIMSARAHHTTIKASSAGAITQLTQSVSGWGGHRKITSTGTTNATFSNSDYFAGGTALANNGVMLKLSGSYEDGSYEKSYYIKKFFARGTEFFFKRPVIEARWDDSKLDDRGSFYVSSSLVSGDDNLQTLHLYNNFKGTLTNIPAVGTGRIYLRLFNTSGTEITTATPDYPVTGGYHDTGIYTASFALETTETTIKDVWLTDGGTPVQTQYYTGSFKPLKYDSSMAASNQDLEHVIKITNLRGAYTIAEKPRFRVYTRKRDWQPNIYSVAKNSAPIDIVENSYFKIVRESDSLEAIGYGTGSLNHTRLSHDMSGSYFDLDMSLLEPGYSYEMSFVFKLDGVFKEQSEKFKFRVE